MLLFAAAGLAAAATAAFADYEETAVEAGGTLTGTAHYAGTATAGTRSVTADAEACGAEPKSDHTVEVTESGQLAGVIVSLENIAAGKPRLLGPTAEMDIARCEFRPHVLTVTVEGKFTLRNTDGILHRPRGDRGDTPVFQWGMPLPQRLPKKIRQAGLIEIRCTLHPWNRAWVGAFEHPYHTVSGPDGGFRIEAIPAGRYTVKFWHERFGEQTRDITVDADTTTTVDVTYPSGAEPPGPAPPDAKPAADQVSEPSGA